MEIFILVVTIIIAIGVWAIFDEIADIKKEIIRQRKMK